MSLDSVCHHGEELALVETLVTITVLGMLLACEHAFPYVLLAYCQVVGVVGDEGALLQTELGVRLVDCKASLLYVTLVGAPQFLVLNLGTNAAERHLASYLDDCAGCYG